MAPDIYFGEEERTGLLSRRSPLLVFCCQFRQARIKIWIKAAAVTITSTTITADIMTMTITVSTMTTIGTIMIGIAMGGIGAIMTTGGIMAVGEALMRTTTADFTTVVGTTTTETAMNGIGGIEMTGGITTPISTLSFLFQLAINKLRRIRSAGGG